MSFPDQGFLRNGIGPRRGSGKERRPVFHADVPSCRNDALRLPGKTDTFSGKKLTSAQWALYYPSDRKDMQNKRKG